MTLPGFGSRPSRRRKSFLFQQIIDLFDGPVQLVVLALCALGKVFRYGDIGIHTMSFFEPGAVGIEHAEGGDGDITTVDERWRSADADEAAPGAGTDEGSQACFTEIIREGVAARAAPSIDQHNLWPEIASRGPAPVDAVTGGPESEGLAVQHLYEAVGDLSSTVEALVYHQGFFIQLCSKLADQLVLAIDACTTHIDVTCIATGGFVYLLSVVFDPGQVAQS